MSAAIFGLLGVLVGGVLSSVGDAWLDRRRQLLEGMAAARLVSSEVRALELEVDSILKAKTAARSSQVATTLWAEHRTALADVLSVSDWHRVVRAQTAAEQVNQYAREAKPVLAPSDLQILEKMGKNELTMAREALDEVGNGSRLTWAQTWMFRATGGWLKA